MRFAGHRWDQGWLDHPEGDCSDGHWWYDAHPQCTECGKRGCPEPACGYCEGLDGLVMLTDGLIFHPGCLARVQALEARMGR